MTAGSFADASLSDVWARHHSMNIKYRPVTMDEYPAFCQSSSRGFLNHAGEHDMDNSRRVFEPERSIAAFDGEAIVGTAGSISLEMTVPGGRAVPTAGLTFVAVQPTHRRGGILTEMMRRHFQEARARGDPLSALQASESIIYGRFGYGMAVERAECEIDGPYTSFRDGLSGNGRVVLVERERIEQDGPDIWDRFRSARPGMVTRSASRWKQRLLDPERGRSDASGFFFAVHEHDGQTDGYVIYRVHHKWERGHSGNSLEITELIAATHEAEAALWRFCLDVDLIAVIKDGNRPLDDQLYWRLADPRRLKRYPYDHIWVRLVDLPTALQARTYGESGRLVITVADPHADWNSGTWKLEAGRGGAGCARSDGAADLIMGVAELGAAYFGGVTFSTLARAGRIEERRQGALRLADAMFAAGETPWCPEYW